MKIIYTSFMQWQLTVPSATTCSAKWIQVYELIQ